MEIELNQYDIGCIANIIYIQYFRNTTNKNWSLKVLREFLRICDAKREEKIIYYIKMIRDGL